MGDVSAKLLGQFVENLEATVLGAGDPTPPAELEAETETAVTGAEPEAVAPPSVEVEPIDLMATAGSPLLKRALPLVGVSVLAFIVVRFVRRRRRGKG